MRVADSDMRRGASAAPERPGDAGATPKRERSRWVRRLADVLLIAGGLLLAYPFWSAGYAQIQQNRLNGDYRETTEQFATVVAANTGSRPHDVPTREVVRRLAVLFVEQVERGDPVGRLKIPRVSLDRVVQQGTRGKAALDPDSDRALLQGGPVHYGNTPLPGAGMPFAIAGHRTTFGAPFYRLDKLKPGDPIYVDTPYARFRYAVAKVTEVLPTDIGVLEDRGYGLVLTTCTPAGRATRRLIVWATLERATPLNKAVSAPSR